MLKLTLLGEIAGLWKYIPENEIRETLSFDTSESNETLFIPVSPWNWNTHRSRNNVWIIQVFEFSRVWNAHYLRCGDECIMYITTYSVLLN